METLLGALAVLVLLAAVVSPWLLWAAFQAWRRARGERVIVCPETGTPEGVTLDRRHAARVAVLGGEALRLSSCTRWPERAGCGEECIAQIESAPDGCSVRSRLEAWYAKRMCVLCGHPFEAIAWLDHKPGLLTPEGKVLEWPELRAETLSDTLSLCYPICWDCSIAEGFRQTYPDLVIDDPLHHAPRRDPITKVS